ncbi:MAG: sulfotransferase family protein [Candidatus Azobacteroides sp.]|nr:sulfotransferase family protein [Candidatus Azobacteroides sp.]
MQHVPESQIVSSRFMGNCFCLLPGFRAAFVVIPKNGITFLKKLAIYFKTDEIIENSNDEVHKFMGYRNSQYLVPASQMSQYEKENGRMLKFAVWRDPVERFISCYKYFCLERSYHLYFHFLDLYQNSFEYYMKFVELELSKNNPLYQDDHLRRQSDFYKPDEVDYIVPIHKLNQFLTEKEIPLIEEKANATSVKFELDLSKWEEKIKELYQADYNIKVNY